MMHEIVLGGHLYLQLLKEKLDRWLLSLKFAILKRAKDKGKAFDLTPQVPYITYMYILHAIMYILYSAMHIRCNLFNWLKKI